MTRHSWTLSTRNAHARGWDSPKLNQNDHFTGRFGLVSDFLIRGQSNWWAIETRGLTSFPYSFALWTMTVAEPLSAYQL